MSTFDLQVQKGQRYGFGNNWRSYLSTLTDERIAEAEKSIMELLGVNSLNDKKILDIGSGSGLFSLAMHRLGAEVYSFDYDPTSVACTKELRSRYYSNNAKWIVEEGSVLDEQFLKSLSSYDIVYSWGVLHHTGNMWTALENAASLVKKNGNIIIAIYNSQGRKSQFWKKVKKFYCSGILGKTIITLVFIPLFFLKSIVISIIKRENEFTSYKRKRGMSITHDWFDWLGGFPFEVASVDEIFHFFQKRGFVLKNIKTTNGLGNNQFVFVRKTNG